MPDETPFMATRRVPGERETELAQAAGLVWNDERQCWVEAGPQDVRNPICGQIGCPVQVTHSHVVPGIIVEEKPVEADPNGLDPHDPGAKLDDGKAPVWRGCLAYFPRALKAVSRVSQFGANKYSWGGWASVPDGYARYSDALGRHLLDEMIDGIDAETDFEHDVQVAWNALARLELRLRRLELGENV